MGLFSIFSNRKDSIQEYAAKGALVLDVRSPQEFSGGHVKGSKNIPLQELSSRVAEIQKWDKPLILCCASGVRSGQAKNMLKSKGIDCINGGGWQKVQNSLN